MSFVLLRSNTIKKRERGARAWGMGHRQAAHGRQRTGGDGPGRRHTACACDLSALRRSRRANRPCGTG